MNREELIEELALDIVLESDAAAIFDFVLAEVDRQVSEIHKPSYAGKGTTGPKACEECFREWPCPTSVVLAKLAKPEEKPVELPASPWLAYAEMMGVVLPSGIG